MVKKAAPAPTPSAAPTPKVAASAPTPAPPSPSEVAVAFVPAGPSSLVMAMRKLLAATPTDLAPLTNWGPDKYALYLTLRAEVEALLSKEK